MPRDSPPGKAAALGGCRRFFRLPKTIPRLRASRYKNAHGAAAGGLRGVLDAMLRRLSLIVCLAIVAASPTAAQAPGSVFLEDLTWTELRDQIRAGATTILVPIGGTEQNGPHMAIGKHNVRVRLLCEKIARALGNALVAPVIAYVPEGGYNPPTGHMRYPGTISISEDAYEKMLEGAARSFKLHGFRDIVFLGDHGSDQSGEKIVADRLNREWASTPVHAHAVEDYYRAAEDDFAKLLIEKGYKPGEVGPHAGLADTSLMLALDPRLVRTDRLNAGANADGIEGDPAHATAELGQLGVDLIVAKTVAAIRQAQKRP
jgi:creatinine amidohydrolase